MPFPESIEMPEDAAYSLRLPMALAYAAVMHAGQRRKDPGLLPYITHPLQVMNNVWRYGGEPPFSDEVEELAIGGLLHDVVEDAGGPNRLAEIEQLFGRRVAAVVYAATDSTSPDPEDKQPWRLRKEQHIARVRQMSASNGDGGVRDAGACLVIACDKLHNLTETAARVSAEGPQTMAVFKGGPDGTRWYYLTMFDALQPALPDPLVAELERQLAILGA